MASKLNDFLHEIAPDHEISQIHFSGNECEKGGHWEIGLYTYKGMVYKRLVWVCD